MARADQKTTTSYADIRIALVGMSNIGKSHLAGQLAKTWGSAVYDVDKHIADALGHSGLTETASWMGTPGTAHYNERTTQYLALEKLAMFHAPPRGGLILDTTGSLPHLDRETHLWLKDNFFVVFLKPDPQTIFELQKRFFEIPKPVIWGRHFTMMENQSYTEAARRCYPNLLHARNQISRELANISFDVLPGNPLQAENIGVQVLNEIEKMKNGVEPKKYCQSGNQECLGMNAA